MQFTIILFGQLAEIAGSNKIAIASVPDTDGLVSAVNALYTGMADMHYIIAVDKKVIQANTAITEKNELALLPAFSGG